MATVQVNSGEAPLIVEAKVSEVKVATGGPISVVSQTGWVITVNTESIPVEVTVPGITAIGVSSGYQPIIAMLENPSISTPGPQGERGSTFLGGYPTLVNLPVIDGVSVKRGDFALVKDTGTIYQVT